MEANQLKPGSARAARGSTWPLLAGAQEHVPGRHENMLLTSSGAFAVLKLAKCGKHIFDDPLFQFPTGKENKEGLPSSLHILNAKSLPSVGIVCRNMSPRSLVPTPAARRTTVAARQPANIFAQWASLHKHAMNRHDVAWGNNALLDIYHVFISYQRECD